MPGAPYLWDPCYGSPRLVCCADHGSVLGLLRCAYFILLVALGSSPLEPTRLGRFPLPFPTPAVCVAITRFVGIAGFDPSACLPFLFRHYASARSPRRRTRLSARSAFACYLLRCAAVALLYLLQAPTTLQHCVRDLCLCRLPVYFAGSFVAVGAVFFRTVASYLWDCIRAVPALYCTVRGCCLFPFTVLGIGTGRLDGGSVGS